MNTTKKGAAANGTHPTQGYAGKVTTFPRHLQEVLEIISDGKQYTAKEINIQTGRNDARKSISELISLGVAIQKRFAHGNRHKLYWLETKNQTYQQAELFPTDSSQNAHGEPQQARNEPQPVGNIIAGEWAQVFRQRMAKAEAKMKKGGKYEK